jgi:hypothetical protein
MAEQRIAGMNQAGIANAVGTSTEAAVAGIAAIGRSDMALGTLNIRIPHDATPADLTRAIRLAIAGRVR